MGRLPEQGTSLLFWEYVRRMFFCIVLIYICLQDRQADCIPLCDNLYV